MGSGDAIVVDRGERIIPDEIDSADWISSNLYTQHLQRYDRACELCRDKFVVDIASGSGYGSFAIAEAGASFVLAIDVDAAIVGYARERYPHSRISYRVGSSGEIYGPVDLITCFETVEHVREPDRFMADLRNAIDAAGTLLISATTVETSVIYPFHLHDFTRDSFEALCERAGFKVVAEHRQHFSATAAQVRAAMRRYFVMPRPAAVLSNPWRAAKRIVEACVTQGLEYDNSMFIAVPVQGAGK